MDADWPASVLEAKFGQAPGSAAAWDAKIFDKYWRLHVAENREKWPPDADEVRLSHPRPNVTTLLDHEQAFWLTFVVNGSLEEARLSEGGYSESQIPWIKSEMLKLGWLPS